MKLRVPPTFAFLSEPSTGKQRNFVAITIKNGFAGDFRE
jgi:hypothetical protein